MKKATKTPAPPPTGAAPNRSIRLEDDLKKRISKWRIKRYSAGIDDAILTESQAIRMLIIEGLKSDGG